MAYNGNTKFNTPKGASNATYKNHSLPKGVSGSAAARLLAIKRGAGLKSAPRG